MVFSQLFYLISQSPAHSSSSSTGTGGRWAQRHRNSCSNTHGLKQIHKEDRSMFTAHMPQWFSLCSAHRTDNNGTLWQRLCQKPFPSPPQPCTGESPVNGFGQILLWGRSNLSNQMWHQHLKICGTVIVWQIIKPNNALWPLLLTNLHNALWENLWLHYTHTFRQTFSAL